MKLDLNERVLEFFRTAYERQLVYTQKESKSARPWTRDEILRDFYFVNLFRNQDPTNIFLEKKINELCAKEMKKEDIFFNIWLFRCLDNVDSWSVLLGDFIPMKEWNAEEFASNCSSKKKEGLQIFSTSHSCPSVPAIVSASPTIIKLAPVVVEDLEKMRYMEDIYELLTVIPSIGAALGYRLTQDCGMGDKCITPKALNNDWAPATSNAISGLELLYNFKMTPKEAVPHLNNLKEIQYEAYMALGLPANVLQMNMSSIERWLGEFQKYWKIKNGEENHKKYNPPFS